MKIVIMFLFVMFLSACGARVEVPPAHVGKILGSTGFMPEVIPPSKFRLGSCWWPGAVCQKLILLQAADVSFVEKMSVLMPKERLNVTLDVRGVLSVSSSPATVKPIYEKIIAGADGLIEVKDVYTTYVQPVIRGVVRNVTTEQDGIEYILNNREAFAAKLFAAVIAKLEATGSPIKVSRMELSDFQPPESITNAYARAAQRKAEIEEEQQLALKAIVKAEKDLEVAKKQRLVRKERALAIAEENRIAAKSVTAELLAYRRLEVIESLAKNGNVVFMPMNLTVGAQSAIMNAELIRRSVVKR